MKKAPLALGAGNPGSPLPATASFPLAFSAPTPASRSLDERPGQQELASVSFDLPPATVGLSRPA